MGDFMSQAREDSGEPLLLIHGSAVSWTIWREVLPFLSSSSTSLRPPSVAMAAAPRSPQARSP